MKATPRITYTVRTRDVDGSDRRTYTTAKGALLRFESMSGRTLRSVLEERALCFGDAVVPMTPEAFFARQRGSIDVVSDFGTVVVLSYERHELTADERERLALAQIDAVAELNAERATLEEFERDQDEVEAQRRTA